MKFRKFFKNSKCYGDSAIEYPVIYEELHRDIEAFNEELDAFNAEHQASFQELLHEIESVIQKRFPGQISDQIFFY